jgi:hypothetical protein
MTCFVCDESAKHRVNYDVTEIDCSKCGRYQIEGSAIPELEHFKKTPSFVRKFRYLIANRIIAHSDTTVFKINPLGFDNILDIDLPDLAEQAEKVVLWLGETNKLNPLSWVNISNNNLVNFIGANSPSDVKFIAQNLVKDGLLDYQSTTSASSDLINLANIRLNLKGWRDFNTLKTQPSPSKLAFMAMTFGNPDVMKAFKECFRPAVLETGYELRIVTDHQPAGLIDDHIIVGIQRSRFVIADLTDGNRGAYWEAGYAEGIKRPVIYTCEKSYCKSPSKKKGVHFDTAHRKIIRWELGNWEKTAEELITTIRATIPEAK